MSKIGYEEALAENEALKDQIAIVLAQKKGWRRTCENLKKQIVSLKQDLEVAKDNEIHLETINELREENKRLKSLKFRQYVATDEKGNIVDYAIFDNEKVYPLKDYLKIVEKQAVKEFAEKLKDKFNGYEATSYNGYEEGWHDLQEEINDLLKEYGIGEE